MMSISNTTPSISAAPARFLGSISVNNLSSSVSTESAKLVLQPQAVFQVTSNISLSASSTSSSTSAADQGHQSTTSKSIIHTAVSSTSILTQRPIRPSAIITISTPTRATVSQPAKASLGKHHLPVRPITSLSHVAPKPTITTTISSGGDPGGGFTAKTTSVQSTIQASAIAAKPKATQHIFMAPGLRTPNPSLKHHATYSSTSYPVLNQNLTTTPNSHPTINVATTRSPASVLVRPIISASPSPRTLVPLTMSTSTTSSDTTRPTSVMYHPTSTISISIPAKSSTQAETARFSLSSSQVGRSIYQVGLTTSNTIQTLTAKPQRPLVSLQPGTVSNTKTNFSVPLLGSTPLSTSSGFASSTRLSSIAAITTSAVTVAKLSATQPNSRIPTVSSSTSSSNASIRSSEASTTSTTVASASIVPTLVTTRPSTYQSPIVFWPQTSNSYPTPYMVGGDRTPINLAVSNSSVGEVQNRSSQSAQYPIASTQVTVPAFTQGQLLHSSNSAGTVKDRPAHHPVTTAVSSSTPHLNSSPKPTILRRPQRVDTNITKKLVFDAHVPRPFKTESRKHNNVEAANERILAKPAHEYPFIKPELTNQGGFGKPVVTSNGVSPANKVRTKDFSPSTFSHATAALNKEIPQLPRVPQQNFNEIKVKSEPTFHQHGHFKIEAGHSHITQPPFHPSSYALNLKDSLHHAGTTGKISIMGPHMGILPVASSHSTNLPIAAKYKYGHPNFSHQRDLNIEPGSVASSGGLKRDHKQMNESHQLSWQSKPESVVTLSPRKKPRKQTHIVAEDLPEQVVDDEMSTDDADEGGDDVTSRVAVSVSLPTHSSVSASAAAKSSDAQGDSAEYIDDEGVRYVSTRVRPPITLWSGHRLRTACNHFNHYSQVRAKEKRVSLQDTMFNESYLKGWKILQFTTQFDQLAKMDDEVLHRVEQVKEGLIKHVTSLIHNGKPDQASPPGQVRPNSIPVTPCSTPGQPKGFTSFVMSLPSTLNSNLALLSSHPCESDEKASRLREEVLKVDDMAQANIQRCKVVQEQLEEAKMVMIKVLKQRSLACRIVKVGRETQRSNKQHNGNGSRNAKKKKT